MTADQSDTHAVTPRKVVRVPRDIIEGARLQVALDQGLGRISSPIIERLAAVGSTPARPVKRKRRWLSRRRAS